MPLSDEEMRLLEQMERALVEEDPKFASTLRGTRFARATRIRIVLAVVVFVAGVALLMTGAVMGDGAGIAVGITGFVAMLASATVGLSAYRGRQAATERPSAAPVDPDPTSPSGLSLIHGGRRDRKPKRSKSAGSSKSSQPRGTFIQRMEQRWQRRRDQRGF